jgi:hypothetical protein
MREKFVNVHFVPAACRFVVVITRKDDAIVCYSNTSVSGKSVQKHRILRIINFRAWCSTQFLHMQGSASVR